MWRWKEKLRGWTSLGLASRHELLVMPVLFKFWNPAMRDVASASVGMV